MEQLEQTTRNNFMQVLQSNWIVIALYILYFIILAMLFGDGFPIVLIIHGILIFIALTPIGEAIMRLLCGTRKLHKEEKAYLQPIFDEVYERAKQENPKLSKNITLFMSREQAPNAFATGSNTVCVTKGAMDFFSKEELKGILAHEIGHINNWDTKILMIIMISNLFISFLGLFVKFFFLIGDIVLTIMHDGDKTFSRIILGIKSIIGWLCVFLISAITSLSSRVSEKMADQFAYILGYGKELQSALETLKQLDMGSNPTIMERIHSSHPDLDTRIDRLESLEDLGIKV